MNRAERRRQKKLARKQQQNTSKTTVNAELQDMLERGVDLHNSGALDEAASIYAAVIDRDPNHPAAQHLLAIVHHQKGENEYALKLVSRALRGQPEFPEALNTRGSIYKETGVYQKALADFDKALQIAPHYLTAKYNRGLTLLQLDSDSAAAECFEEIINEQPDKLGAYYYRGCLHQKSEDHEQAIDRFRQALAIQEDYLPAVTGMASSLSAKGHRKEAEAFYRKGLEIDPVNKQILREYASFLVQNGRVVEASDCYKKCLQIEMPEASDYVELATLQVRLGQYQAAESSINSALKYAPDSAEVRNNLGVILRMQGKYEESISQFEQILITSPENALAISNMASSLISLERLEEAESALQKALQINPELADAYFNLGLLYQLTGRMEKSGPALDKAIQLDPGSAPAHNALGASYQAMGRLEEAVDHYQKAISLNSDYAAARRHLAFVRKQKELDDNARSMQAGLENPNLADEFKIHLAYGLGKVLEDIGQYDEAFEKFELANSIQRKLHPYDDSVYQHYVDTAIRLYSKESVGRLAGFGYEKPAPIFIVGMPRSGTTLAEQILSSHPNVYGAGELPYIARLAEQYREVINGVLLGEDISDSRSALTEIGREYAESTSRLSNKPVIIDKMPGNYMHVGLIKLILPEAKIIHCRRSAEDTCISIFKHYFSSSGHEYKNDMADLARAYNRYKLLMKHWHYLFPEAIYDLDYEKLVSDQVNESRGLLAYCELEWDDRVIEFHRTERSVLTASSAQVRAPLYKDSLQSWKRFEPHLAPLLETLSIE
jgi:tetratricopeptide (TPR) repeat protein